MKKFRRSIVSILCCSILATLAAQDYTPMIDSLEKVLTSGAITKREEKIELLLDLSHAYLRVDTAKCKAYAMEVLKIAQNSGSKLAEANAYNALANFYIRNQSYYHAHACLVKAEKILFELDNKDRLYTIYKNMMSLFVYLKENDNLEYYANKVLTISVERKDWIWMLNAQRALGDVRFHDDNGQEALDYFLNLYQKALHTEDSLGLSREFSSIIGIRCAQIYYSMKRFHEALPYLHQIRKFYESRGIKIDVGMAYDNLAMLFTEMHNIDSAEYYINKAMDPNIINYHNINKMYLARSRVDSLKGNYLNSLANYQKYHYINDSLSKEEKSTEMARLKLWHEFDQKENEKRILQQEFQKQRKLTMILTVSLIMTLALLALAVFFYRKITKMNREMNEKNCKMKELHTVKDKLFSVVAHDLRNPISALASIIRLVDINRLNAIEQELFKGISSSVDNTCDLLDNLLGWAKSQMQGIVPVPVYFDAQEESRSVTDSLQAIAAKKQIVLENCIEQMQLYADRNMFAVVLRNLTTNAIKYTSAEGTIILASDLSGDMLTVSVKDTGTGISQEIQDKLFILSEAKSQRGTDNENGTGLGLVLCADFVKANGGNIWFTSVPGEGSTFFFSVPSKNN